MVVGSLYAVAINPVSICRRYFKAKCKVVSPSTRINSVLESKLFINNFECKVTSLLIAETRRAEDYV